MYASMVHLRILYRTIATYGLVHKLLSAATALRNSRT